MTPNIFEDTTVLCLEQAPRHPSEILQWLIVVNEIYSCCSSAGFGQDFAGFSFHARPEPGHGIAGNWSALIDGLDGQEVANFLPQVLVERKTVNALAYVYACQIWDNEWRSRNRKAIMAEE